MASRQLGKAVDMVQDHIGTRKRKYRCAGYDHVVETLYAIVRSFPKFSPFYAPLRMHQRSGDPYSADQQKNAKKHSAQCNKKEQ